MLKFALELQPSRLDHKRPPLLAPEEFAMNNRINGTWIAGLLLTSALPLAAVAQDARNQGYLVDTQGQNAIVRAAGAGVCVRTSDWSPARAVADCDPDIAKKPEPKPAPKPVVKPKPEEKPKPAAQPGPKPVVSKLAPQRISLSADALFDFDKATLKPAGKAKLDEMARVLQGATYDVIVAIGHTDRIGSTAYNQKLSLRRAEAVKRYLTEKGIDAKRVSAEGRGKTQPVTKPGDCKGSKAGKALIACLQPDRRVDVEVTGTKEVR